MKEICEKIILALDLPDLKKCEFVLDELKDCLKVVKIGSASFYRLGEPLIQLVKKRNLEIFLDFKFHDIPNTVAEAIEGVIPWGLKMFTVHLSGGADMLKASVKRTHEAASKMGVLKPMVLGISVLTSIDQNVLKRDLRIPLPLEEWVSNLAGLARECGLDGIVASAHEIERIREVVGNDLKIVCPGIRMADDVKADQKRTLTVGEALKRGADFLVIGRPIYEAARPREMFEKILSEVR
ncbi:MAG: orotidine-5'-phosphate decarboxylase [Chlamydiae bacterium]|nr:orotidine-5'-phosphate decarboxylase [Chlamydiota bacterium]MBI3277851.1 orotidine-5'-phosphate decarboxylase [Chlamydiota bacterium]